MKSKKARQKWWKSLTAEEQSQYIAKWERKRKSKRKDLTGHVENLHNGIIKVWTSPNSYSILKPNTQAYNEYMAKQSNNEEELRKIKDEQILEELSWI